MARSVADNFLYKSNKPLDARAQFDTVLSMKEFEEKYIPEGFLTFCIEDGKTYRFKSSNTVDATTGKWREEKIEPSEIYEGYYTKLDRVEDYAYEAYYNDLNYALAYKRFAEDNIPEFAGGCSSVRVGNMYGRNLDWLYNEQAEFVLHTPSLGGRYATTCTCGQVSGLTDEFVKTHKYSEDYIMLPFYCVDGINEKGVFINVNVVPAEKGNTDTFIEPMGSKEIEICANMIPRYVLDNFATALEAVTFIKDHMRIYFSKKLKELFGYEPHFMVGDKESTYIVELAENKVQVYNCDTDLDGRTYMTNFHLTDTVFNASGAPLLTPATAGGQSITAVNKITPDGAGLERYNLIENLVKNNTPVRDIMNMLMYTKTYTADGLTDKWYTELVGTPVTPGGTDYVTVDSSAANFETIYTRVHGKFPNRTRNPQDPNPDAFYGSWQTTHSVVYNLDTMEAEFIFQENATAPHSIEFKANGENKGGLPDLNVNAGTRISSLPEGIYNAIVDGHNQGTIYIDKEQTTNLIGKYSTTMAKPKDDHGTTPISCTFVADQPNTTVFPLAEADSIDWGDGTGIVPFSWNEHTYVKPGEYDAIFYNAKYNPPGDPIGSAYFNIKYLNVPLSPGLELTNPNLTAETIIVGSPKIFPSSGGYFYVAPNASIRRLILEEYDHPDMDESFYIIGGFDSIKPYPGYNSVDVFILQKKEGMLFDTFMTNPTCDVNIYLKDADFEAQMAKIIADCPNLPDDKIHFKKMSEYDGDCHDFVKYAEGNVATVDDLLTTNKVGQSLEERVTALELSEGGDSPDGGVHYEITDTTTTSTFTKVIGTTEPQQNLVDIGGSNAVLNLSDDEYNKIFVEKEFINGDIVFETYGKIPAIKGGAVGNLKTYFRYDLNMLLDGYAYIRQEFRTTSGDAVYTRHTTTGVMINEAAECKNIKALFEAATFSNWSSGETPEGGSNGDALIWNNGKWTTTPGYGYIVPNDGATMYIKNGLFVDNGGYSSSCTFVGEKPIEMGKSYNMYIDGSHTGYTSSYIQESSGYIVMSFSDAPIDTITYNTATKEYTLDADASYAETYHSVSIVESPDRYIYDPSLSFNASGVATINTTIDPGMKAPVIGDKYKIIVNGYTAQAIECEPAFLDDYGNIVILIPDKLYKLESVKYSPATNSYVIKSTPYNSLSFLMIPDNPAPGEYAKIDERYIPKFAGIETVSYFPIFHPNYNMLYRLTTQSGDSMPGLYYLTQSPTGSVVYNNLEKDYSLPEGGDAGEALIFQQGALGYEWKPTPGYGYLEPDGLHSDTWTFTFPSTGSASIIKYGDWSSLFAKGYRYRVQVINNTIGGVKEFTSELSYEFNDPKIIKLDVRSNDIYSITYDDGAVGGTKAINFFASDAYKGAYVTIKVSRLRYVPFDAEYMPGGGGSFDLDDRLAKGEGEKAIVANGISDSADGGTVANKASGAYAFATGQETKAIGACAFAAGIHTTAEGYHSFACGSYTEATGANAFATGDNTSAEGEGSFATGLGTAATGAQSVAEGYSTEASGIASHAEGFDTHATYNYAHAEGYKTHASAGYAHAEGGQTYASASNSHAEG